MPSSIAPVPHSSELLLPKPPSNKAPEDSAVSQDMEEDSDEEFNISHPDRNSEPHFPCQQELDDLVRGMGLTKSNAKLLTSRWKEWNLLDLSCRSSLSRKRHARFSRYFSMAGSLCLCSDVDNLFEEFGIAHDPRKWHPFKDSSSFITETSIHLYPLAILSK